jgi:hypothetical protein
VICVRYTCGYELDMMILNDLGLLHVVNIVELCMNCHSLSLIISFIFKVLINLIWIMMM